MDDREILILLNERNEEAVSAMTERYGGLCRSLIGNILRDERDIEECLNSVFMRLWSSIPPAQPENLTAYTAKTARNEALMRLRTNKRGSAEIPTPAEELTGCLPPPDGEVIAKELTERINCFLKELPSEKRKIFVRRYWFFDPIRDISRRLGISESKVKSTLFRLRNELKEYLGKEGLIDEKK